MADRLISADALKEMGYEEVDITDLRHTLSGKGNERDAAFYAFKCGWNCAINAAINNLTTIEAEPRWIPIKTRPMTAEEKADWEERTGEILADEFADYFDCSMPEDGQEILISCNGRVSVDTCWIDEYGIGLESNGDWYGISAWMPQPEPYREAEE